MTTFSRFKEKWNFFIGFLSYHLQCKKRVYKYRLAGEARDKNGHAIVYVRGFGYNKIAYPIKQIYEDSAFLEEFNPQDIARITLIALGEIIFALPENERLNKFQELKKSILRETEGS